MKRTSLVLFLFVFAFSAIAQRTNTRDYVYVLMEPDHADWTYHVGDSVEVAVSVRVHHVAQKGELINYEWGPDQRKAPSKGSCMNAVNGVSHLKLAGAKEPGFMTLKAWVTIDGKEYSNLIKLAFDPESLKPTAVMPDDFMEYWQGRIAKARELPLQPIFVRHQEYDTPFADAYEVRFQNAKKGTYMYGMLCVPKGVCPTDTVATRRYPAVVLWPGAGVKQHLGDTEYFPEHGVITLEMGVHGISVCQPQQVYTDLVSNALSGYSTILSPNKDEYYYNKIYVGTVKTVDLLCSMACVDTTRIAAYGGSQGGALSLVNAALDKRIKCIGVAYPALAEIAGYYRGRAEGWPHLFCGSTVDERLVQVADYYDVVNMAANVGCKTLFFLGYNDITCCPTSTYTAYNMIQGEKRLVPIQECGHWMYPAFHQMRREWIVKELEAMEGNDEAGKTNDEQKKTKKKK